MNIDASQTQITGVGTITTGTWNANTIAVDKGGTGVTSYGKGNILVATVNNTLAKLPVGPNNYVLTADSTEDNGVKWAASSGGGGSTLLRAPLTDDQRTSTSTRSTVSPARRPAPYCCSGESLQRPQWRASGCPRWAL